MNEPSYHLEGIVRTRSEEMEDFNGPLDVILLLLIMLSGWCVYITSLMLSV